MNNISLSELKIHFYRMKNDGQSSQSLVVDPDSISFLRDKNGLRSFLSSHHVMEMFFEDLVITMKDSVNTSFKFDFSIRYHINYPIGLEAYFSIHKKYSLVNSKLLLSYVPFLLLNLLHVACSCWLLVLGYKVLEDIIYISRRISFLDKQKDRAGSHMSSQLHSAGTLH